MWLRRALVIGPYHGIAGTGTIFANIAIGEAPLVGDLGHRTAIAHKQVHVVHDALTGAGSGDVRGKAREVIGDLVRVWEWHAPRGARRVKGTRGAAIAKVEEEAVLRRLAPTLRLAQHGQVRQTYVDRD